jgi:hypothetical protein
MHPWLHADGLHAYNGWTVPGGRFGGHRRLFGSHDGNARGRRRRGRRHGWQPGRGRFRGRESPHQDEVPFEVPFAPVTDATVGYPTELSPAQYGIARDLVPGLRYRAFDGHARGDQLTFWVSPLEVWSDWCAMQTPHLWTFESRREYRCSPEGATEADTDLGVHALCTSAEELAYCTERSGFDVPCVCLDDREQFTFGLALCSLTYCECSADACQADFRGTTIPASLRLEGDTLTGNITFDPIWSWTRRPESASCSSWTPSRRRR